MKVLMNRVVALLALCAMTCVMASAKTISKEVTFNKAVMVNGTLVKAGTYKVVFDDQSGELTIAKGKKIVAKTTARLEKVNGNPRTTYSSHTDSNALLSVTLKDGNQATITSGGNSKEAAAQQ